MTDDYVERIDPERFRHQSKLAIEQNYAIEMLPPGLDSLPVNDDGEIVLLSDGREVGRVYIWRVMKPVWPMLREYLAKRDVAGLAAYDRREWFCPPDDVWFGWIPEESRLRRVHLSIAVPEWPYDAPGDSIIRRWC